MLLIPNKLLPWQIAQAVKTQTFFLTLPLVWSECYWTTWCEVFREV